MTVLKGLHARRSGDTYRRQGLESHTIACYMTMVITMVIFMSRHIKASEFKAKCLTLMDEVARTGTTLVITKNGKPVAELVPHRAHARNARGILKDELFIIGDIIGPIDVAWDALK
jgi:prevent-host-death family protein